MKYGLDFGTSNSAISFFDHGEVSLLPIEKDSDTPELMPSLWYFEEIEKKWYFGRDAFYEYKENGGAGRFIQSVKKLLPDPSFSGTRIGHKYYSLECILTMFFSEMKKRSDAIVGADVKAVTIGRPVRFSSDLEEGLVEQRLESAARTAGFESIDFMLEPLAATYLLKKQIDAPATVFTLDIGGGTTDAAIVRLFPDGRQDDRVLSAHGSSVGGMDFTSAIMDRRLLHHFGLGSTYRSIFGKSMPFPRHLLRQISDWYNSLKMIHNRKFVDFLNEVQRTTDEPGKITALQELVHEQLGVDLFDALESVKMKLSFDRKSFLSFKNGAVDIEESIKREEFESYIENMVDTIGKVVDQALSQARIGNEDIDSVLMVGGSSRVPRLQSGK